MGAATAVARAPGDAALTADAPEVADADAPDELQLAGATTVEVRGQRVLFPSRETYLAVADALRRLGFELCSDLCAVDYLHDETRRLPDGIEPERFEVVVNLTSFERRERVRVRVQVPESDPVLPTLFHVWPGTEAMEREAFDMFGIRFDGHPDLTRILMPEDWEGHPLRKDYSPGRVPVQFKDAPGPR
jgi:NADH-quinone oxidoreductase subunit C